MFYVLSWFIVVVLLILWSMAALALNAVLTWTVSNAGALSGSGSGSGTFALPEWLAFWVPPELVQVVTQLMAGLEPVVDSILQSVPALAGGLTVATWVLWGVGSALLILLGAGLHLIIAMWRRHAGGARPQPPQHLAS